MTVNNTIATVENTTNAVADGPSRLLQFVLEAVYGRFQLESKQPALVQAAANLIINFRLRGNIAGCISSVAHPRHHRNHMDVLNSFTRRLSPIISIRIMDVARIPGVNFKSQMIIFVVDGLDGFK